MNIKSTSKWRNLLSSLFKFRIIDLNISAFLVALLIILTFLTKYTALKIINLNFEYLFYILLGFFVSLFPALIVALIGDTVSLFISGNIGFWHPVYAVVPLLITTISFFYFNVLRKLDRHKLLVPNIFITITNFSLILICYWQINNAIDSDYLRIGRVFGFTKISISLIYGLIWLMIAFQIICMITSIISIVKKNHKLSQFSIAFGIVSIIIVIFRWFYGPYAYFVFLQYVNYSPSREIASFYPIWMAAFALKSLISIPIYTAILFPTLLPFEFLRNRYILQNKQNQY